MKTKNFNKRGNQAIGIAILGFTLFFCSTFITNAQVKIDTYSMSALGNKDYNNFDISISDDNTIWIDAYATYSPGEKCGFILEESMQSGFISTLENARDQFSEWKRVSIDNNITEVKMKMDYIFFTGGYFSYLNKLKSDSNVRVIYAFTYFNGDYVLIMNLEKMTAEDNDLISFEGTSVIFNSEQEIDTFLSKISEKSIKSNSAKL